MKVHHIGYLVKDIGKASENLGMLGFSRMMETQYDSLRKSMISFWKSDETIVELVSPDRDSDLYALLKKYKNCPYHMCYDIESADMKDVIEELSEHGYVLFRDLESAEVITVLEGHESEVAFLMGNGIGMVELLKIDTEMDSCRQTVVDFLNRISDVGMLSSKLCNEVLGQLEEEEIVQFAALLKYYTEYEKIPVEDLVQCYSFISNMMMEETYYFMRHGKYRNTSFKEVEDSVYNNSDYMKKYMVGLTLSDYMWLQHLKMVRLFNDVLPKMGGKYLEIGPGFGQYLSKATLSGNFESLTAIDLSEISVNSSNRYLEYLGVNDKCTVVQKDFFEFDDNHTFDTIVIGEVLEHVEQPQLMLEKIYKLLAVGGTAFVTTVINAPAFDHIYLFNNANEVEDMCKRAGFQIKRVECYTAGDISMEKAIKKKMAIDIALVMTK